MREAALRYPIITLTGPRQSGKTTLTRAAFPRHEYVSLEQPDERRFALEDPRGFLGRFRGPFFLDEAQRAPDLFSYIQTAVDEDPAPGRVVLSGSQNFLVMQGVSQSLAGRCAVLHLLPLSLAELERRPLSKPETLAGTGGGAPPSRGLEEVLFTGFYPRIHDRKHPPQEWLADYYQTYLERDVRNILNVGDLEAFSRFIRLCAGRCGQVLELSGLASDCGITHPTARKWLSVLEASFIVTLLRPHHRNFGKRLIKSPKLYFLDTGLLCWLLRIRTAADLETHAARGAVFETFVLSELTKSFLNRGERPEVYFWRDSNGREVDFVIDLGKTLVPIEAKSGRTVASDWLSGLARWRELAGKESRPGVLVYGGDSAAVRGGISQVPWFGF